MQAVKTLPTSTEDKETHWLRRTVSLLHHEAMSQKMLMGIWRAPIIVFWVTGSTRIHNLAVRSIRVLTARLAVTSLLGYITEWAWSMLSVTGPTNTHKDDLHAAAVLSTTVVQA
eukprot:1043614-Pelagomonas_calceolata.AAC.5